MLSTQKKKPQCRPSMIASFLFLFLATIYLCFPSPEAAFPQYTTSHTYPAEPHLHVLNTTAKRVAIIGAGAGGSSAAWFLTRAADVIADRLGVERNSILDEVVVFDQNDYVGGRTTTVYPHGDQRLRPAELGGSIFVAANRHMNKGAKRFGLKAADPDFGDGGIGVWDGQQFVFTTSTTKSWWLSWADSIAALRRYGAMSPYRTTRAVNVLLKRFSDLYNPLWLAEHGAASSIDEFAERVGLGQEYTTRRGDEWGLKAVGVGEKWLNEIWGGSTRTNYASDIHDIHALGASVSMATGGAKSVLDGNWRIFDAMLDEAKATRRFKTSVVDIIPLDKDGRRQFQVVTNDTQDNGMFDQIFYAAPWYPDPQASGLPTLERHLIEPMPRVEYVKLHVTLATTSRSTPNPAFFNMSRETVLPTTILTSSGAQSLSSEITFQSISWHGETAPGSGEYVVKIFSLSEWSDETLTTLLGQDPTWVVRKTWYSYPKLHPLTTYPPVEPVAGVQYLAALEPWVSTMETQTLSARERVARVVQDWWNVGYGECEGGADAWDWSCEE